MKCTALVLGLLCLQGSAADKDQQPYPLTKVEPDWGSLDSGCLTDLVEVELLMLPSGEPFSLSSIVSLPDPVVRALSKWRFSEFRKNRVAVPFRMIVKVPVRRPPNKEYESLQLPRFQISDAAGASHTGDYIAVSSTTLPGTELAVHSREALLAATDAHEVISAMLTTQRIAQGLVNHQTAIPEGYDEFCQALLKHTRELYPQIHAGCKRPEPAPTGAQIETARLIHTIQPSYPPQAQAQRMEGNVRFRFTVDTDGAPRNLELLSGPLALYEESYNSVLQWRWKPATYNGVAVNLQTEIVVHYVLQSRP